jgi:hypothetical protein
MYSQLATVSASHFSIFSEKIPKNILPNHKIMDTGDQIQYILTEKTQTQLPSTKNYFGTSS